MKHPLGQKRINGVARHTQGQAFEEAVITEIDSVMCHVSPVLITNRLQPSTKSISYGQAVFFSENEFMSNYGDWIYLFSKKLLKEKYGLHFLGHAQHRIINNDGRKFKEKEPFEEFICECLVYVEDALGIIQHRDLSPKEFKIR